MNDADATALVDALFDSLAISLVRYARHKTRYPAVSEDLVQEAFMALYRELRAGKSIRDPKAWLLGAVRNQSNSYIRERSRHREDSLAPEALDLLQSRQAPDDCFMDAVARPSGLNRLSSREEEVVLLRLQSFKYREIAVQLGIGTKSVCTLLARALKKLKAAGGDSGGPVAGVQHRTKAEDALH